MGSALGALALCVAVAAPSVGQDVSADEARKIREMADRIEPVVAQMRGLDWKFRVDKGVYSRTQLRDMIMRDVNSDKSKADIEKSRQIMVKLGIMAPDFDLRGAILGLYGDAVAGFYNPETRELNLVQATPDRRGQEALQDMMMRATLGVSQDEMVMAHELTHALDDQHFDLLNIVEHDKITSDQRLAQLAVIEGTAVSIQYDFLFQRRGIKSYENPALRSLLENPIGRDGIPGAIPGTPEFLVKNLSWPYSVGNRLVFTARKRENGGWTAVNRMFDDLPASTEMILHPEKYLDEPRDYPVVLVMPEATQMAAMLGPEWVEIDRDTFGEFQFWMYFEEIFKNRRSAAAEAKRAAAGWDGDTMVVLQNNDDASLAIVWVSTWDTETDAVEFFNLYRNVLQVKYTNAPAEDANNTTLYGFNDTAVTEVIIERRGKDVVIVESVPAERARGIVEATFNVERRDWTRPARGNKVPKRGPGSELQSPNFSGKKYANDELGVTFELPREGFKLVREEDGYVAFLGPDADREQTVAVKLIEQTAQAFADTGFAELKGELLGSLNAATTVVDRQYEHAGAPAWKFIANGHTASGNDVIVALIVTTHDDRLVAVVVSGSKDAFAEIANDVLAVSNSVRTTQPAARDE